MCRADIGITLVPLHKRNLVQCRRLFWCIAKEYARARTALNPEIPKAFVLFDEVIARIEPRRDLERILPHAIGRIVDPALGIHIEKHRAERFDRRGIKPIGQSADRARIAKRVDKKLVWIDDKRPMPRRVFPLEPIEPIHAEARTLVACCRGPERNVGLLFEIFTAAVIAVVVDDQEVIDAELAIILEKIGKPHKFVAQGGKDKDVGWRNIGGAILYNL